MCSRLYAKQEQQRKNTYRYNTKIRCTFPQTILNTYYVKYEKEEKLDKPLPDND